MFPISLPAVALAPLLRRATSAASLLTLIVVALALTAPATARAQQQLPANLPRITQAIDPSRMTILKGNVHPLARPQFDHGAAAPALPMHRMLMVLKRSDAQEHALKTLIDEQQDKHSSSYRQWLTPTQLGESYGPADADIQAITAWLQSQGFQIGSLSKGRTIIEFSGSAGQVASAFHTAIHSYVVNGEQHYANNADPQVPTALTPVVAGIASLNNFPKKSLAHLAGTYQREKSTGKVTPAPGTKPLFTYLGKNGTTYAVTPYDLATIYNIAPLWTAGTDGTGQTIAIPGRTNINPADDYNFRTLFNLPTGGSQTAFLQKYLNIILNGVDPGNVGGGEEAEADIDTQWSGAVAKGALIDFVVSQSTETSDGADLSALYIIDNNLAPVMSYSFGLCELGLGTTGNQFENTLWEQAAAQGISVFVAAGDSGASACDSGQYASYGLQVSGEASTPYATGVGGTDFDLINNNPSNFWGTTNDTNQASALGYIPETTWNNSCTNAAFSTITGSTDPLNNCNDPNVQQTYGGLTVSGGGGGPSSCIVSDGSTPSSCGGGYAKPSWQTQAQTYNDNVRDTPDIALFASNGFEGSAYIVCQANANPNQAACDVNAPYANFQLYGGTSVASPAIAGVFGLLNQKLNARVGNANYVLYNLAASQGSLSCDSSTGPSSSCIFNDVTAGTISQPCDPGSSTTAASPNCGAASGDSYGILIDDNGSNYPNDLAWDTQTGYDYATGLGSINVANLVNQWSSASFTASATTLALSSTTFAHGTPITATVKVTSSSGTPSGDVSFNGVAPNGSVGFATLANGTAQATLNSLPGGSYNVVAHYGGDNNGSTIFAGSDSNPVAVTVAPEASVTTITPLLYNPQNGKFTAATTAPYGSGFFARADVQGTSGNGTATGTVAITDNGTALTGSPFKLNSTGDTENQNYVPGLGAHSLSGSYSGDPSFNPSTGTATLTITQAPTSAAISSSATTVTSAGSVTLTVTISPNNSFGSAPTGSVTFTSGSTSLGTATLKAATDKNGFAIATATLAVTGSQLGTGATASNTPAPASKKGWNAAGGGLTALACVLLFGIPAQRRRWTKLLSLIAAFVVILAASGCGGGSSTPKPPPSTSYVVTAAYAGDTNYNASSTATGTTVTVTQ